MTAVELGQAGLVEMILRDKAGTKPEISGTCYDHGYLALLKAFELGSFPCARLLYEEYRDRASKTSARYCDAAFLLAVENGRKDIVRHMAEDCLEGDAKGRLRGFALESACRARSKAVFDLVLEAPGSPITDLHANVAYWAGRSGSVDILRAHFDGIVQLLPNRATSVLDVLAGAAFHSLETVACVLELAGCAAGEIGSTEKGGPCFARAACLVLSRMVSESRDPNTTSQAEDSASLDPACNPRTYT